LEGAFNENLFPDAQAYFYINATDTQTLVSYGGASKSVVVPEGTVTIGERVFVNSGITSAQIPNSVITIADRAFQNNQLTSIIIPSSVTSLGRMAFSQNQLTSVTFTGTRPTFVNVATGVNGIFGYNPIPDGGISVPSMYLEEHQAGASGYGVTAAKIIGY
jgi:hypothetical protein